MNEDANARDFFPSNLVKNPWKRHRDELFVINSVHDDYCVLLRVLLHHCHVTVRLGTPQTFAGDHQPLVAVVPHERVHDQLVSEQGQIKSNFSVLVVWSFRHCGLSH